MASISIDMADWEACTYGVENLGICLACGETNDGYEPDARGCPCEVCGENKVYGLDEAILMGVEVV